MIKIGIIGAGSWALALGYLCNKKGYHTKLWEYRPDVCERIVKTREVPDLLPNFEIPKEIQITSELKEVIRYSDVILIAIPSHTFRNICEQIAEIGTSAPIVIATKGLEVKSNLRMSEILCQVLKLYDETQKFCVLSGPSHAEEVIKDFPTSVTLASTNLELAKYIQHLLSGPTFRLYASIDVIGVELGGALKNVIAIAAGISDGLGYGDNTKGMLMTRGLAEMSRLGVQLGGLPRTFAGLSGIGDLITTCMSKFSRNRYVGEQLGKGIPLQKILSEMKMVAEGVNATVAAVEIGQKLNVDLPISKATYDVMFSDLDTRKAAIALMTRTLKHED
ncbi:MAG: NAD(P)-dependent glycerol-3-phosphate dehydrogenase [bacterium]|nr:NAD(P)-dependent glycerol-3-phosphate dehydrogenase [bacterium]